MYSFFIPTVKHFCNRHFWQNRRVTTVTLQSSLNGHVNSLVDKAFRRKNALQLSHVMALKLYPNALSPQTLHILPDDDGEANEPLLSGGVGVAGLEFIFCQFVFLHE